MRLPLDPLPRVVSTKVAVLIVALVVLGTALTVREYVRTTEPAPRGAFGVTAGPASRPAEVRAAAPQYVEDPARRIEFEQGSNAGSTPCTGPEAERADAQPTLFEPGSGTDAG